MMLAWPLKHDSSRYHHDSVRGRNSCVQYVCVFRCSNVTRNNYQEYIFQHSYKIDWIYKPKLHSRCNKNTSTAFLKLKFSRWRFPEPHLREGLLWPDHFSKAGDGPELGLTVLSRQKGNDQEPIQSSSTSRPKHQTGEGQDKDGI